jgi:hypothetical protein
MSFFPLAAPWRDFLHQVNLLQALCSRSPERSLLLGEGRILMENLQQMFQSQILPQSGSLAVSETLQRFLTETHRQLRLLSTDFSLYQAARTEALQQQRGASICKRLNALSSYGQAIEQVLQNPSGTKALPG